jgi:2-desacetyl-2-hydroxyethyl bacteriochlorophyllide A dehydrogenase
MRMRSARFNGSHFDVVSIEQTSRSAGEILVEIHACGICGSDLHFFSGEAPAPRVCPGHEICGRVLSAGIGLPRGQPVVVEPLLGCANCDACRSGEPNLCTALVIFGRDRDGGFADCVVAPAGALYPVPSELDLDVAMLAEPLAVALHALRKAAIEPGMAVLVIGGGTIGLLTAFLAARAGGEVTLSARYAHQREAGMRLGAVRAFATDEALLLQMRGAASVAFETVGGHALTLPLALACLRPGGTIVATGVFSRAVTLDPLALLAKEVRLVTSMMYSRRGRPDFAGALDVLRAEQRQLAPLITHEVPLEEIQRGFELANDKHAGSIKVAVRPGRSLA